MRQMAILLVLFYVLTAQVSWGQVPETMSFQGSLMDASGKPLTGNHDLNLSIYDVLSGGTALWSQVYNAVPVNSGVFNVILGAGNPLNMPFDKQYWLGVKVNGGPELVPRMPLTSSPYSLNARSVSNAWKLTGNSGTDPSTNFLGTTDDKPLELRVNGQRIMLFEPLARSGSSYNAAPNIIGGFSGNTVGEDVVGATLFGGGKYLSSLYPNSVNGMYGTVSGGLSNQASSYATVGGGHDNTASGGSATVPGGYLNTAQGKYSFAACWHESQSQP